MTKAPSAAAGPAPKAGPTLRLWWAIPLLLVGAGLAAYGNSFSGVFLLDDKPWIVVNPKIHQLWPPWTHLTQNSRPLVQLSLAINYALGGLSVWGYHAFNLAVHLLAGLALFGIVRRMLGSEPLRPRYGRAAPWLAGAVAIIWTVHPLQTESVTYVIQRTESMMGLFLLLTLYCGIRSASSPHPVRWHVAGVVACALGMGSKEVMVVAPLVMLVYDRMFIAASFEEIVRRRAWFYAGLAASWLVLGTLLTNIDTGSQRFLVANLTPWRYAVTQFAVILHYLRLSLWPQPLVFDYAWPLAATVSSVIPQAVVVLALVGATVLALLRRFWAGFWGAWFFLILAPTSTVLPIADVAVEHRMYVPLAAVVALVVIGGYGALDWGLRRLGAADPVKRWLPLGLLVAAVVVLASTTARRNDDYRSDLALWTGVAAARPDNPRARLAVADALDARGRPLEAIAQYRETLRLKPDYVEAHVNLGAVLLGQRRVDEAIAPLAEAVRLKPDSISGRNNLGAALFKQGKQAEAIVHLSEAARLNPDSAYAHYNLAIVLAHNNQIDAALGHYATVVRIEPNNAKAHNDFANALVRQGNLRDAVTHYSEALRINPGFTEARNARGSVMERLGQPAPAL